MHLFVRSSPTAHGTRFGRAVQRGSSRRRRAGEQQGRTQHSVATLHAHVRALALGHAALLGARRERSSARGGASGRARRRAARRQNSGAHLRPARGIAGWPMPPASPRCRCTSVIHARVTGSRAGDSAGAVLAARFGWLAPHARPTAARRLGGRPRHACATVAHARAHVCARPDRLCAADTRVSAC